ncbi:hypothetical protein [Pantoea agglomerans]|uniref:hypothetical protein n=1 Tax=Enterobacter agglomerans TaxID=549 RepID=UPI000E2123B2|nr:hypothetical protein [Pantoea agglomerans]MCH9406918.1 hypothetical protein [Pantoea agglomerans]WNK30644.1 hypothetical protein RM157_19415 [Pantoea agglomerans]WNK62467.1 hypothetical protein RM152_18875 [Pantoea agglomerans]
MTEKLLSIDIGVYSFKNSQLKDIKYFSGALELNFSLFDGNVKSNVLVSFEWIHSFRVTDEGDLLKMQDDLNGQMITGIYTVEGSHYLSWFNEQSANIHDGGSINHYLIVTGDDVIEVLSSISPTVISC